MAYSKFLLSHWISPYLGEIGRLVVNVLIALLFFSLHGYSWNGC